jgi:ADP-ribosyl-[dinitrogen reductase] hydrolase
MNRLNRIKGGLYGVAIGDALGGTTEFMTRSEVKNKYGYLTEIIGGGVWDLEPGEVTDDTMMTLAVGEGIVRNPHDPIPHIGSNFMEWYRSDPKDIGNIIRRVLSTYNGSWFEAAYLADLDLGQSAGNGSLMRCLPVGLSYPGLPEIDKFSRLQSKMTHYDERCSEACTLYNRIVFRIMNEEPLREAVRSEIGNTVYASVLSREPDCEPSGYVVHSFNWALFLLLRAESFAEVVQTAANLGGDSDTIAAIAGGIAGVYDSYEGIPASYSTKILIKDRLDELAEQLAAVRVRLIT